MNIPAPPPPPGLGGAAGTDGELPGVGPTGVGPTGVGPTGVGPTGVGPTGVDPTGAEPPGVGAAPVPGVGPDAPPPPVIKSAM